MEYKEEDYLQLSGLQHFSFCKRQWALAHIEMQWQENLYTVQGHILHERAHDAFFTEQRKGLLISRDMPVFSRTLGVSGACDIVEFHTSSKGISLFGREGTWRPCPVEYKRGVPKEHDADRLQLCCQAMCLEEMLLCPPIEQACLYYGETRHRETVALDTVLRGKVTDLLQQMHTLYQKQHTPKVKPSKSCNACSLREQCLPKLYGRAEKAGLYISARLEEIK